MNRDRPPTPLTPRSGLVFINSFRAALLLVLLTMSLFANREGESLVAGGKAFYLWSGVYAALIGAWFLLRNGRLAHTLQLTLAIAADIAMIVLLMGINDGVRSGYGILLLPYLAVAGLLSSGRYALFYASIATLILLSFVGVEQYLGIGRGSDFYYSALLATAGFITSIVTWKLGRVARDSEALATRRGGEIANLNRLNELVLQSQRDAVVVLAPSGLLRQFNNQAARYFGAMRRGHPVPELLPLVERWRHNGCPPNPSFIDRNIRGRQLVGRMVPVLVGDDHALLLFMRDMADMAEEGKRVKLAALGRLTANIAHEIRNPLSAINHAADLLAEDETDPARQRLIRIVQGNSKRINHMVQEVLALNRRDRIKPEPIRLQPFLDELLDHFGVVEAAAAGAICCVYQAQAAAVQFDRGHFGQILNNLLANAWRYSSKQPGAVRIEVGEVENHLTIKVMDDGPGMSEDAQARLFEPFFTTESAGTGLGLYIARELAEANDARLDYCPPGGVFRLICHKAYG
ncbi:sensor histidine kinase [Chromobacterium haemolyticum]|uniref:sensor histidine kinase n=1 Tax=Chromobacterium haemolyticum TaxID=394935 RepID=UPI000684063B|nr:ATP-binding protein [Chromobacterium haemolyticum]